MHPDYWIDIAKVIEQNYNDYEGFVVLHGTDTMTYTATALSFLLENLNKPVIVTGSQCPIGQPRSDAIQNLVSSLMIAAPKNFNLPLVPEVCIFFQNYLLRGNRSRKISSTDYAAFHSPNFPLLGQIGEHIKIQKKLIRIPSQEGFFINENFEKNVLMFDIFPGINLDILKKLFNIDGLKGVVLRTFGAGNAPTNKEFLREIEYGITKKNLAIVNVTQCIEGMAEMGLYDASVHLLRLGVISGVDMTPEAALVKMQFLLGLGYDIETVKNQMQIDLRGEQSVNVFNFLYDHAKASPTYKGQTKQLPAGFEKDQIDAAHIRVDGVTLLEYDTDGEIKLACFMNYPNAEKAIGLSDVQCLEIPQCLGIMKKMYINNEPVNMMLDCREKFGRVITPGRPVQITIVSMTEKSVMWESATISVYTSVK